MHRTVSLAGIAAAVALAVPGVAGATTFCVNGPAECSGFATPAHDLQNTLQGPHRADGQADTVFIGPGTYTSPGSWRVLGKDALEIRGSGRGKTVLTSSASQNIYVLNAWDLGLQDVRVRDLDVAIPSSFPDDNGPGAGAYFAAGRVERVRVTSANPGSAGIYLGTGGTLGDVAVDAPGATAVMVTGLATIEDSTIRGRDGVRNTGPVYSGFSIRRSTIEAGIAAKGGYGVLNENATADVRDTVVRLDAGATGVLGGVYTQAHSGKDATTTLDHMTLVSDAASATTIGVVTESAAFQAGNAGSLLRNSIVRGYGTSGKRIAGSGPNDGSAGVTWNRVLAKPHEAGVGNGKTAAEHVVDADPQFEPGTSRPGVGSPAVDAGDPGFAAAGPDRSGAPRVADGNGDGSAVTDLGAFERPAAAPAPAAAAPESSTPRADAPPRLLPLPLAATFAKPRAAKVLRSGRTFLVRTGDAVACRAGGPPCTVTLVARSGRRVAGRARLTVAAGRTAKLSVKLTRTAAKRLRATKRLRLSLALSARKAGARDASLRRTISLRRPR